MRPYKILTVDDHPVIMLGIRAAMEHEGFAEVIECPDFRQIGLYISKHEPDVILLDLYMPKFNVERDFSHLKKKQKEERFIAYSADDDETIIRICKQLGFDGFIHKSKSFLAVKEDISAVLQGKSVFPPTHDGKKQGNPLTRFQLEVLRLMAAGCKNRQIAQLLDISIATVDYHKRNIKKTLAATTSTEAVARAKTNGWI